MISEDELVAAMAPLDRVALRRWIDQGWIIPHRQQDNEHFDESDVARVRLIAELHYELRIEEDSMSVVLSLLDQLYSTRRSLNALMAAVKAQPEYVRKSIAALAEDARPHVQ
jgi:chaperone modulatory protein CbpM